MSTTAEEQCAMKERIEAAVRSYLDQHGAAVSTDSAALAEQIVQALVTSGGLSAPQLTVAEMREGIRRAAEALSELPDLSALRGERDAARALVAAATALLPTWNRRGSRARLCAYELRTALRLPQPPDQPEPDELLQRWLGADREYDAECLNLRAALKKAEAEIAALRGTRPPIAQTRQPAQMFPPGSILSEEIEARGWSQQDLAERLREPLAFVQKVLSGAAPLTPGLVDKLAAVLGIGADGATFWSNLVRSYSAWLESEPYLGPCDHGRDPYTRCDECGELSPVQARRRALRAATASIAARPARARGALERARGESANILVNDEIDVAIGSLESGRMDKAHAATLRAHACARSSESFSVALGEALMEAAHVLEGA